MRPGILHALLVVAPLAKGFTPMTPQRGACAAAAALCISVHVASTNPALAIDTEVGTPQVEKPFWKKAAFGGVMLLSVSHSLLPEPSRKDKNVEPLEARNVKSIKRASPPKMMAAAEVQICTGPTCSKNGARALLNAALGLANGGEISISSTACLRPCRGIVTRRSDRRIVVIDAPCYEAAAMLDAAALMLADEGVEGDGVASTRASMAAKLAADVAMAAGDPATATALYTEAIEGACATSLLEEARRVASPDNKAATVPTPKFGVQSSRGAPSAHAPFSSAQEAERVLPGRVSWLYHALLGRCSAQLDQLEQPGALNAALADATDATKLCGLASGGWYCLRDAAEQSGDRMLADAAIEELGRLGYSLKHGEEGLRASATKGESAKRYDPWGRLIA